VHLSAEGYDELGKVWCVYVFRCIYSMYACMQPQFGYCIYAMLGAVQGDLVVLAAEANQLHHKQQLLARTKKYPD
jgi:hypothetical protein